MPTGLDSGEFAARSRLLEPVPLHPGQGRRRIASGPSLATTAMGATARRANDRELTVLAGRQVSTIEAGAAAHVSAIAVLHLPVLAPADVDAAYIPSRVNTPLNWLHTLFALRLQLLLLLTVLLSLLLLLLL